MVAFTGQSIQELLNDLFARVGAAFTTRQDLTLSEPLRAQVKQVLDHPPSAFAGVEIMHINKLDGCKLILPDNGWYLIRPSGTEPVLRCYGEAKTPERLAEIMKAGRELLHIPAT
jgi:phosphoglucomutase